MFNPQDDFYQDLKKIKNLDSIIDSKNELLKYNYMKMVQQSKKGYFKKHVLYLLSKLKYERDNENPYL